MFTWTCRMIKITCFTLMTLIACHIFFTITFSIHFSALNAYGTIWNTQTFWKEKKAIILSSHLIPLKLILYPEDLGSSTSLVHSCHKGVQQYYLYIYIFLYLYHKYCQSFLLYYIDSLKKYMNMNWKDFGTTMDFKKCNWLKNVYFILLKTWENEKLKARSEKLKVISNLSRQVGCMTFSYISEHQLGSMDTWMCLYKLFSKQLDRSNC